MAEHTIGDLSGRLSPQRQDVDAATFLSGDQSIGHPASEPVGELIVNIPAPGSDQRENKNEAPTFLESKLIETRVMCAHLDWRVANASRLALITDEATLINTALVAELRTLRFEAILDVTAPEPVFTT